MQTFTLTIEIVSYLLLVAFSAPYYFWAIKVNKIAANKRVVGRYDLNQYKSAHAFLVLSLLVTGCLIVGAPSADLWFKVLLWWNLIGGVFTMAVTWYNFRLVCKAGKINTGNFNVNMGFHIPTLKSPGVKSRIGI